MTPFQAYQRNDLLRRSRELLSDSELESACINLTLAASRASQRLWDSILASPSRPRFLR